MQIFFNLIDQPVSDRLTESLDRQINKLGQYLFNADATESTSGIDTFVEFDDRMMDTSIQQEILHSENEIYLKLLTADNNGDYAFETLNERDPDSIALDNTFTTDYANGLFTTFADYTDGTNTIGLDSQSNSTYGDVDYDEGLPSSTASGKVLMHHPCMTFLPPYTFQATAHLKISLTKWIKIYWVTCIAFGKWT